MKVFLTLASALVIYGLLLALIVLFARRTARKNEKTTTSTTREYRRLNALEQQNDEYSYGHDVKRYHIDGEGDL